MERLGILLLCLTVAIGLQSVGAGAGENPEGELCIPVGIIELAPPEGADARKAAVEFPHAVHFDYSCQTCHHKWEKEPEIRSCMASGCHDLVQAPTQKDTAAAIRYYKNAFHQNCIDCHKKIKIERKKMEMSGAVLSEKLPRTGPTGCKECHLE
jgi:hypothetical protein